MRLTQPKHFSSQLLETKVRLSAFSRLFIAYSGGIDSHVLLHLCASNQQLTDKLTAVYVNHGLQVEAENWGKHCEHICKNLGVKFLNLKANAQAAPGESPEEAARNARYGVLKPLLGKDDVLLVAQHADDQLETVLLQLFRGGGLKGLSGMPPSIAFGKGKLVRPLLAVSKANIIDYANQHGLHRVEDPTNQQSKFDRNFLRNDIIPTLKQRWPALDQTVPRSASHCAEAQRIISELAKDLLTSTLADRNALNISLVQNHVPGQQQLILRQWFDYLGLKAPSQAMVQCILKEIVAARADADPILLAQGHQVRRYRQRLYCIKPAELTAKGDFILSSGERAFAVNDTVTYAIVPSDTGISVKRWQAAEVKIYFRAGGEAIQLPGRKGHHSLKKLFQEAGIPPWQRPTIPYIYLDGKLAAVGENWVASAFYSAETGDCLRLVRKELPEKSHDGGGNID